MSNDCTYYFHISNLYKRSSNLAGWILRTFTMRDPQVMLTLYIYIYIYIYIYQRAFTKHITGLRYLSYSKRLEVLKLYSLQRSGESFGITDVLKIVEGLVPNLSDPITCSFRDRRGRTCVVCHSGAVRLGTLKYNSFR